MEELRRLLEETSAQQAVLALNTRFTLCCNLQVFYPGFIRFTLRCKYFYPSWIIEFAKLSTPGSHFVATCEYFMRILSELNNWVSKALNTRFTLCCKYFYSSWMIEFATLSTPGSHQVHALRCSLRVFYPGFKDWVSKALNTGLLVWSGSCL